jgi:hypothetical protein
MWYLKCLLDKNDLPEYNIHMMMPITYTVGFIVYTAVIFWLIGYHMGKTDRKRDR